MKRIISLLLIFIMSCSVLVGCDWKNIFNKETSPEWEAPDGVVETTTTDKDGNPITIAHSDNFTQDDIEFVAMRHGGVTGKVMLPYTDIPAPYTLGETIRSAQNGSPLFLMHFENPYIICSYLKSNLPDEVADEKGYYYMDVSRYVWYKFYDYKSIPEVIENMQLSTHSYLLYDCIIVKNICTGTIYNKQCKYWLRYKSEYTLNHTKTNMMVLRNRRDDITAPDVKFFTGNSVIGFGFEVYIDENGVEYLFFEHESYFPDGSLSRNYSENLFYNYTGDLYEIASPHFEILKEYIDENGHLITYAGIKLDVLLQLEVNE